MLQSLEQADSLMNKPRIVVLEVRNRKSPDGPVIAHVVVERQETSEKYLDGQLRQACISLSFRQTGIEVFAASGHGEFHASYSPLDDSLSLTTHSEWDHGFVTLDLQGLEGNRIGTYLMNEIVRWARQWPGADIREIELLAGQASSDNKDRRNRFYERFGLVFDYADSEHRAGKSRPMKVRDLKAVDSWQQNIVERRMFDFLTSQEQARLHSDAECRWLQRSAQDLNRQLRRAEAHPVLWAMLQIYEQRANWVIGCGLLAGVALLIHFVR